MNKAEVKKMIKERSMLLNTCEKLSNNADDKNSIIASDLYTNSRNSIDIIIKNIDKELLEYAEESPVGIWLMEINGMAPHIAAALLAYFNIKDKQYAAQFIKYSGVGDSSVPHNNDVKNVINELSSKFKSDHESLYGRLNDDKFIELLNSQEEITLAAAHARADRYMQKVFISHLFDKMYLEENGSLPDRHSDVDRIIIEPEVPYYNN
jgi:hypothetical protein